MRVALLILETNFSLRHFVIEFAKTYEFEDGDKKALPTLILALSLLERERAFLDRVSSYTVACTLWAPVRPRRNVARLFREDLIAFPPTGVHKFSRVQFP